MLEKPGGGNSFKFNCSLRTSGVMLVNRMVLQAMMMYYMYVGCLCVLCPAVGNKALCTYLELEMLR